ncbi:ferredoxin reductase [Pengzhenrongella phosphoraccumulans]|uniref:ferredoxin reductase n=1 Tax=Pengzhenrongella phosphoraccumulans TaxID=3114394 RepID=UPI00388D6FE8
MWQTATLVATRDETPEARTLVLDVPDWPGHLGGQHVDVRLTADDGYQATRSYSLAAPADHDQVEITVQRVPDGEVSTYLTDGLAPGEAVELRGPAGGWFVWRPSDRSPVLLVGGGSGIVPLMSMVRARRAVGSGVPFRLVYSMRSPRERYYAAELDQLAREVDGPELTCIYTRTAPDDTNRPAARIGAPDLTAPGWSPDREPTCFVCGPTGFVEVVAALLVSLGHDPRRIKTERFGPSGR